MATSNTKHLQFILIGIVLVGILLAIYLYIKDAPLDAEEGFAGSSKNRKGVTMGATTKGKLPGQQASKTSSGAKVAGAAAVGAAAVAAAKAKAKSSADGEFEKPTQEQRMNQARNVAKKGDNVTPNALQKELLILEEQVTKANTARDRSELNLATTKNFLEEETQQNIKLSKRISSMSRDNATKQGKCLSIDGDIIRLKRELDVAKVQKKSAEDQIGQIRSQLQSVQKDEPLTKKLQLQMEQLNQAKSNLEIKMVQAESRLNENVRKQGELRNEIKELQKGIGNEVANRNESERKVIQLKNRYEKERIARRAAEAATQALRKRLELRNRAAKSQQDKLRLLKTQYVNFEKREAESKRLNLELQDKQTKCKNLEKNTTNQKKTINELKAKSKEQQVEIKDMRITIDRLKRAI